MANAKQHAMIGTLEEHAAAIGKPTSYLLKRLRANAPALWMDCDLPAEIHAADFRFSEGVG